MQNGGSTIEFSYQKPPKNFFRILIADDEKVVRDLLRAFLNEAGYSEVDGVETGEEAIAALSGNEYHLVLVDKNLPGMDGLEVLRDIKKQKPEIEVIIITAFASLDTAIQAIDLGAFGYITKPFSDIVLVIKRMEGALERVAMRHQGTILLGRLERVMDELKVIESEVDFRQAMVRVRNALERLRIITKELRQLGIPAPSRS